MLAFRLGGFGNWVASGNIIFGPRAVVYGDVKLLSGNIDRAPGSRIKGTISRSFSARLFIDLLPVLCLAPLLILGMVLLLARRLLNRRSWRRMAPEQPQA
jgi:hypothetical protein